jgi:glycerol-3-phosphate dehydrogenase
MRRAQVWSGLRDENEPFDIVVVGGGATGVGVAIDAAARGYRVALFEQSDFGKGTSSRSTKLIHGGVRYLRQGNIPLVMEALRERGRLRRNAPHLVHDLEFVVPNYDWWEAPFYGIGLKVYDALAGRYGFGRSRVLSRDETLERLPTIEPEGLRGGVVYHDGQFDDARLLVHMVRTAVAHGARLLNYARVEGLLKDDAGLVAGVHVRDLESAEVAQVRARVVVNATGVFTDGVRRLDDPDAAPMIRASQGIHLVLDRSFLPGEAAIMVPHTEDGRVLFAVPWHDRVLVGTTDTPREEIELEPRPLESEVAYILQHAARYLTRDPQLSDVRSVFAGLRPLVAAGDGEDTAALSRDHTIQVSRSGLLTITGGKWTTYRNMAEDTVDHAAVLGGLEPVDCPTRDLRLHGWHEDAARYGSLAVHGTDAPAVEALCDELPDGREPLHERLPILRGEVVWAARHEMARTVDDVLARRTRALLLDASAALECAPEVARILATELGFGEEWASDQVEAFRRLAEGYRAGLASPGNI